MKKKQYEPVINRILKFDKNTYPIKYLPKNCTLDDVINLIILQLNATYGMQARAVFDMHEDEISMQVYPAYALQRFTTSGKQVYYFDEDLSKLLSEQERESSLERYMLDHLPVNTFFVERKWNDSVGFIFSYVPEKDKILVSDFFLRNDKKNSYGTKSIYMDADKLIHSLDFRGSIYFNGTIDTESEARKLILNVIQHVIYLTAINAEVEPITKESVAINSSEAKAENRMETEPSHKTQLAKVGFRFGSEFRKYKRTQEHYNHKNGHFGGKGTKKTPHIRRSHFHGYWTGSKTDPQSRKLIVKWVQSVFVGTKDFEEDTVKEVTVHKVK